MAWFAAVAPALGVAPTFTGPTPFDAANQSISVIAADVNADGKPDLITANYGTNGAGGNTILMNTTPTNAAAPAVTGPTSFNAGTNPASVVAADLNADGKPDLVTANYNALGTGSGTILMNTTAADAAAPSFSGPTSFSAGTHPSSVVAADINADGKPDLVTADFGTSGAGGNTVRMNTTAANAAVASFSGPTSFNAGNQPLSMAAADVNADGKPDLITANNGTNGANGNTILINTTPAGAATPTFTGPTAFNGGDGPASIVAADLNADGKPDLITANRDSTGAAGDTVLINATAANAAVPSFSGPTPLNTGDEPRWVVASDINGDAKPDIITANSGTNGAGGNTVHINITPNGAAAPTFSGPTAFSAGNTPYSVTASDVNGDGKPDLISANAGTTGADGNTVLLNTTIGSLPAVVRSSTSWFLGGALSGSCCAAAFSYGIKPLVPLMGDWDGNGSRTPGTFEGGVFKLSNANDASPADSTFTFGDARGFPVAGDFNANGIDDVAVYRNGTWQVRLSDGTTPPAFSYGPDGAWPATIPVSGDWDGNGTDGIGVYLYASATWGLRQTASAGAADAGTFVYGTASSSYPVVGDWNADGIDSIGVMTGSTWALRNTNGAGPPDVTPFDFGGPPSDLPLSWHP